MNSPTAGTSSRVAHSDAFDRHFDAVFRFCLARVGSNEIAEDIASEVFISAARRQAAEPAASIEIRWLLGVARNRVVDHWRAAERERRRLAALQRERPPAGDSAPEFIDGATLEALQALPSRQRAVVALRYLDGYGVGEIAETLGFTYRATESLLARGRRNFIRELEENADG